MVNGAGLALGSIARSRTSGGVMFMEAETSDHNVLAEVGRFTISDRRFCERSWVDRSK